jgi:hypothetical protein
VQQIALYSIFSNENINLKSVSAIYCTIPLQPHGLARNFATKLPPKNSLQSTVCSLVQLKTVKGDLLMELSLVEFFHFPVPGCMT